VSIYRAFFYTFPSKSLVKEPPFMFPNRVPMEREASSPDQWFIRSFIHSFISVGVPSREPSHEKGGKHLVAIHRAPRVWKAYIQWEAVWFPKWIVYNTAVSTPVPCSLQHETFNLGLGRPEPR